jgi:hypothetical protein
VTDPLELQNFRASMRARRESARLQSHAYGLVYDAIGWTRQPVTASMFAALHWCLDVINRHPYDFADKDFVAVKKRLIAAGFSTSPQEEE